MSFDIIKVVNDYENPRYCRFIVDVRNNQTMLFKKVILMMNLFEESQSKYDEFRELFMEVLEELNS